VHLDDRHRIAVGAAGDRSKTARVSGGTAEAASVASAGEFLHLRLELADFLGVVAFNFFQAFLLGLDMRVGFFRFGLDRVDILHDLEDVFLQARVVGLEGVDLGEDGRVFLVGFGELSWVRSLATCSSRDLRSNSNWSASFLRFIDLSWSACQSARSCSIRLCWALTAFFRAFSRPRT
jgi:hypothetical protein